MKQRIFTFLLIVAVGFTACKKDANDSTIKQYDQAQIENYITTNALTGFSRDTSMGDSSGLYYKIINKGTGAKLEYSDRVSIVYTIKSIDGKFSSSDTIVNHYDSFLGHLSQASLLQSNPLPLTRGLQMGIFNILKYRDASMRLIVPSNLAFGQTGFGKGSISNVNTRIAGNQSLEYYVHVINDQQVYDDLVIRNYMAANSLSGYTKTATGLYYKIIKPGTGAIGSIGDASVLSTLYTGNLLNNIYFDESARTVEASLAINTLISGVQEGLKNYASAGTSISLIVPSRLGYGSAGLSSSIIFPHCPLKFEFQIVTVTNP